MKNEIRIEYAKVMKQGERCVKIEALEALGLKELPKKYLRYKNANNNPTIVYKSNTAERIETSAYWSSFVDSNGDYVAKGSSGDKISVGDIIPWNEFQKIVECCRIAGQILHEINVEIRSLAKDWNGKEIVII